MMPMTAANSRIAASIWAIFSDVDSATENTSASPPSGATADRPGRYEPRPGRSGVTVRSLGPGFFDVVHRGLGVLTGDPARGLLPERVRADGRGHLVGTVEAEDRLRVLQDLRRQLVDRALQVVRVETLVGADPALGDLRLGVGPRVGRQVGLERLNLGPVGEGQRELATAEKGLGVGVLAGQVEGEDVAVLGDLGAFVPVGGVEVRLPVQGAGALGDR